MVARASGIKKSNFSASTTIPSTATFDYVYNNTNTKITAANLLSGLGVTGTIVQAGDPTGTAILSTTGTVNSIRTVEDGPGIFSSVSALNGLKLEHNFDQDPIGVPITANMTTASPDFASLLPGSGMSITKTGNEITFTATGVALPATKAVSVNTESDFPAAVTGVITLEDNTVYIISNDITTANRFVLGENNTLTSYSLGGPTLTYTGSATMFTGADVTTIFINLHLDCPTAKVFDVSNSIGGFKSVGLSNVGVDSCDSMGDIDSMFAVNIDNFFTFSAASQGVAFTGTGTTLIQIRDFGAISTSATFKAIDLGTSVSDNIQIVNMIAQGVTGAIGITGAANNANLTATGFGSVTNSNFLGDITPITVIDVENDVQWESSSNQGIPDTRPDSLSYNTAGTTVTITTVNTPVKIDGVWVDDNSHHFTVDGLGKVTYNGVRELHVPITAIFTAYPTSGSNKTFRIYVAINGTVITPSSSLALASSTDKPPVTVIWQYTFQPNDYLEFFIENNSDAIDFTIDQGIIRVD